MKKSVIFLTALLIGTIAGTYAVYELYVKQRMKELGEHVAQEKVLRQRIAVLQDTFSRTEPDVILELWRKSTQPWADAVQARSQYFNMGDLVKEVEIPQEAIPKIYYEQELVKRIRNLENYAADKQVVLGDVNCGVPKADAFGEGTSPKADVIKKHLEDFDYCSALSKMIVDAKPISVSPLKIWPEQEEKARNGFIVKRTTGISMQINTQSIIRFMDKLAQSGRYFRIDEFKIANTDLLQTDPALTVDMVMTQAYFRPLKKAEATLADDEDGGRPGVNQRLNNLFGAGTDAASAPKVSSRAGNNRNVDAEPSAWQRFRRQWLPF